MRHSEEVKFVPLSPESLSVRIARWIDRRSPARLRIGVDGPPETGSAELADRVAAELERLNRPTIRVSGRYWLRAASLRLEYGRQDVQSRLTGWLDASSFAREVFEPLGPDGNGRHLTRLRDPENDRAIRQPYLEAPANSVLLCDSSMLLTMGLEWDAVIRVGTSTGALRRALPERSEWELAAYEQYRDEWQRVTPAQLMLSYDHPQSPAISGLDLR